MYQNTSWNKDFNPFNANGTPQQDNWNTRRHTVRTAVQEHKRYGPEFMDFITDIFLAYHDILENAGRHKIAKLGAAGGVATVGVGADYLSDGHIDGNIDYHALLAAFESVNGPDDVYNAYEIWKDGVGKYQPHITTATRIAAEGTNPGSNTIDLAKRYWKEITGIIGGPALFAGCTDKDDHNTVDGNITDDIAEPMDKLIGYIGTDWFGVNVTEELYEKNLLAIEQDEKSGAPLITPVAAVAMATYLDEDGNEITELKVGNHKIDEQSLPDGWEEYLIPESELINIKTGEGLVDELEHDGHKYYIENYAPAKDSKMFVKFIPHPMIDGEIYAVLIVDQEAFDIYQKVGIHSGDMMNSEGFRISKFMDLGDGYYGRLIKMDKLASVRCPYDNDEFMDAEVDGGYYEGYNLYKVDSVTGKWVS